MSQEIQKPPIRVTDEARWLELVTQYVKGMRYGVVEIVVHDAKVIQIEKTEKVRLSP